MRFGWLCLLSALLLTGCAVFQPSAGNFTVNPIFGDNMVLQRDMQNTVWGTAERGRSVTVEIAGRKYEAIADVNGKWQVKLATIPVGGPYTMKISGRYRSFIIKNILCGDVWICSGQSNMQFQLNHAQNAQAEIKAANYPNLRLFSVGHATSDRPLDKVEGEWQVCTPASAASFSAVAYFFGRDLQKEINVPIGLIHTSWGGTPAEAWTDPAKLQHPILKPILDRITKNQSTAAEQEKKFRSELAQYKNTIDSYFNKYATATPTFNWTALDFNAITWPQMNLPGEWERFIDIDGMVLFRKTITIPEAWQGKELQLSLGTLDDFDQVYFNGVKVGGISGDNPDAWSVSRSYTIPGKLVTPGKAVIAVAVFDHYGNGGFTGTPGQMNLICKLDNGKLALNGDWQYHVAWNVKPNTLSRPQPPSSLQKQYNPGYLFNAMIKPLVPYGIRGVIWYQGEANVGRAWQYRTLLPTMIECWRSEWNLGDFPFLIVELANFTTAKPTPAESDWAELREAQQFTAFSVNNCDIASAIDIGEAADIHPKNKQDVGNRLALAALTTAYGQQLVSAGPLYLSYQKEGSNMVIRFRNVGSGLVARGGKLQRFQIAGADRKFVWANAVIKDDTIIVSSPEVSDPAAVRYAWANNPEGANLYNQEGLPAFPFRTDDWPAITINKK